MMGTVFQIVQVLACVKLHIKHTRTADRWMFEIPFYNWKIAAELLKIESHIEIIVKYDFLRNKKLSVLVKLQQQILRIVWHNLILLGFLSISLSYSVFSLHLLSSSKLGKLWRYERTMICFQGSRPKHSYYRVYSWICALNLMTIYKYQDFLSAQIILDIFKKYTQYLIFTQMQILL